jgi:hypothetical protein
MSNIEILGRPLYHPKKSVIDRAEQSQTEKRIRELSEQRRELPMRPTDLVYERDEKDWWWCEDV